MDTRTQFKYRFKTEFYYTLARYTSGTQTSGRDPSGGRQIVEGRQTFMKCIILHAAYLTSYCVCV